MPAQSSRTGANDDVRVLDELLQGGRLLGPLPHPRLENQQLQHCRRRGARLQSLDHEMAGIQYFTPKASHTLVKL